MNDHTKKKLHPAHPRAVLLTGRPDGIPCPGYKSPWPEEKAELDEAYNSESSDSHTRV